MPLDQGLQILGPICRASWAGMPRTLVATSPGRVADHGPGGFDFARAAGLSSGRRSGNGGVAAAGSTGIVAGSLRRLAETRRAVALSSIYPVLLLCFAWGLFAFSVDKWCAGVANAFYAATACRAERSCKEWLIWANPHIFGGRLVQRS